MLKGHIKKHKDRWCGVVYNNYEKKYNYVYDKNKKTCNDKLKELIKKIEFDPYSLLTQSNNNDRINNTIDKEFDIWLNNKTNCNEDTKNDYRSIKKCHLKPILNIKIKDLNDDVIQKLYNDIIKKNGKKSIVRINRCFSCFVRYLYKKHIIKSNYMDFIELPKQEKIKHVHVKDNLLKNICENLKKEDYQLYMIVFIASSVGLRLGEVLGLDTKNIDLKNKLLKVKQQVAFEKGKGYYITEVLKTNDSKRCIPLMDQVVVELKKYIIFHNNEIRRIRLINPEFAKEHNLLFINSKGNCIPSNIIDRRWKTFKEKNNINPNIRIHDLRRYFATFLMKSNVPDKIAKTLLGHSSVNMTEYYQNSDIEIAQNYMSKMNLNF